MKEIKGFTIVELLIVIAIISVITAIAVPNFMSANIRAKVSGVRSEMGSIAIALEDYKIDNKSYPSQPEDSGLGPDEIAEADKTISETTVAGLGKLIYPTTSDKTEVYLSRIPGDPFNEKGKEDWDGSGEAHNHHYSYFTTGDTTPTGWALVSYGPDGDKDIDNYTEAKNAVNNGTDLYNPDSGITSGGDIVIIGP